MPSAGVESHGSKYGARMDEILVARDGPVATITINRPEVLNAMRGDMWETLRVALRDVGYDDAIRVVVVTGAGSAFCSGADVSGLGGGEGAPVHPLESMRSVGDCFLTLYELPKPTIARVPGVAAGAGANLALMCDLVVAGESARFCEIFARRGLSIDGGGSWILPRLVGLQKAKELTFLTTMLSAAEAQSYGLVTRLVPDAELDGAVAELAAKLAEGPPRALALSKAMLNRSFETTIHEALIDEGRSQTVNLRSKDVIEAGAAWVEKRPANFTGW
jgi:enoyl-CoA hydratase/carnithine racemase